LIGNVIFGQTFRFYNKNPILLPILNSVSALYSIIMAIKYAWKINFYFTRQDKLVYAERLRQEKWKKAGKEKDGQFGVADIDDDHQFNIGGMEKGLRKMYEDKESKKKQERKAIEIERLEQEEDERVKAEQKGNLF